jgi:hypothetical protein
LDPSKQIVGLVHKLRRYEINGRHVARPHPHKLTSSPCDCLHGLQSQTAQTAFSFCVARETQAAVGGHIAFFAATTRKIADRCLPTRRWEILEATETLEATEASELLEVTEASGTLEVASEALEALVS